MENNFDSSDYELGTDYMHSLIVNEGFTEEQAAEQASTVYNLTAQQLLNYWNKN